jgi:heat shock protein HslJ
MAALLATGALCAACADSAEMEPKQPAASMTDTTWLLEEINGAGVIDGLNSPIEFQADGTVTGVTGCNRMTGKADIGPHTIRLGPLATTRRACAPAVMDQEQRYLEALHTARAWEIETGLLTLRNGDGVAVLVFAPAAP